MRVLFVSGLTGFASGGVTTEMIRLIGGAKERGVDVAFVIDRLPGPLVEIRHFPIDYPPSSNAISQIRTAINAFEPDCIHVIGGGLSLLRPMDSMGLTVPWVFTAHNLPPFERISSHFPGHNRLHYLVRNARAVPTVQAWKRFLRRGTFSRVISHSESVAAHLKAYGCPNDKGIMIPFGCDVEVPPPLTADVPFPVGAYPKILTVAGYAHHKGIHDYIAAVAHLVHHFPKLAYRIIGNSRNKQYTQFLQERIDKLKLADHVVLLRDAGDDVKQAAMSAVDLYVQPSHEEGFCLAFAEAAMIAPRLIGCRTGEIAGLAADDPTARVVAPKDVAGLVAATNELMALDVTIADLAARVRRLQDRYSWKSYLDKHISLFSDPTLLV